MGVLGIGPDGHTAGLFPNKDIDSCNELLLYAGFGPEGLPRISMTASTLARCDQIFFLANGSAKAQAVFQAADAEFNPLKYPLHAFHSSNALFYMEDEDRKV